MTPTPLLMLSWLVGCATHVQGMVTHDPALGLRTPTGQNVRLVVLEPERGLQALDGYIVDVWGTRIVRTMRVTAYKVPMGVHGMTAWVGTLERRGSRLALIDRNTEVLWFIHDDSEAHVAGLIGHEVLLEGYVLGTQTVVVVHHLPLD